jgi:CheY-like chemotaxis protein
MAKILVADDADDSAEVLAELFSRSGHETAFAVNGREAVVYAKRFVPGIVFLDLDMPFLDGYGAAKAIRSDPATYHAFLIALSGQVGTDVQGRTQRAGFDFYFKKPPDMRSLMALVEELSGRLRIPQNHRPAANQAIEPQGAG